jgi:rubrerythrin
MNLAGKAADEEMEDGAVAAVAEEWTWTIEEYRDVVQHNVIAFAFAPHLLRSVWYKFGEVRAQVCALVLHRTALEKPGMPNLMISLQRLVLYVVSKLFETSLASDAQVSFAHVPHKRRLQQGRWVHDCWNEREARVMVAADVRVGTQSITHWLAYSYMACGLKWDPPHTYSLLSKALPLNVADCVMAVYLFISGGWVDKDHFLYAPKLNTTKQSADDRVLVQARAAAVSEHLQNLRNQFRTAAHLLHFWKVFAREPRAGNAQRDVAIVQSLYAHLQPGEARTLAAFCDVPRTEPEHDSGSWLCEVCQGGTRLLFRNSIWSDEDKCPLCGETKLPQ